MPKAPVAFRPLVSPRTRRVAMAALTFASTVLCARSFAVPSGAQAASPRVPPPKGADASLARYNLHLPHVPGSLIVRFKGAARSRFEGAAESRFEGAAESRFEGAAENLFEKAQALVVTLGGHIDHTFPSSGAHVVRFPPAAFSATDLAERARALEASGQVEWVEANTRLRLASPRAPNALPNDPDFGRLWGLSNTGQDGGTTGIDVNVLPAWQSTRGRADVLVGIIDTGLDRSHPDIAKNVWTNPKESGTDALGRDRATNGVDDDGNGYVDDVHGWDFVNGDNDPFDDNEHGTHVAGTVGARGDDGVGVVGVAWNVSLVGLKFLDASGSGSLEDAVKAIEYSTRLGVHVTNNSWGGGSFSPTLKAAIDEAGLAGILFVAAAGNESNDNDASPSYPASYLSPNIISVAAIDGRGRLASFSNRGARSVHLGAPGVAIFSAVPGGGHDSFDGTSMAAPHVAGAAALLKAAFPTETAERLRARLLSNTRPLPSLAGRTTSGGLLNVAAALEVDTRAPARVTGLRIVEAGITTMDLEWDESGDDGTSGRASTYALRTSRGRILTEEGWNRSGDAPVQLLERTASGRVRARVWGLPLGAAGHFTVRAVDNVGNVSALAPSVPFTTVALKTTAAFNADSLEGITTTGTWGLESTDGGTNRAFSDSPKGPYADLQDTTLTLPARPFNGRLGVIAYRQKVALEEGYDFGVTEISTDGGKTFVEVARTTGETSAEGWKDVVVDISPWLKPALNDVVVRLRLRTDFSETREGWRVDDVKFQSPL